METTTFKTNIKCAGCVANVTPFLNEAIGKEKWNVDISNPSKILTVTGDTTEAKIREAVEKAGYKVERV